MSAVSKLIKVNYTDLTNYTEDVGGDVLGCPFEYFWGPVDQLLVLNKREFFNLYPEAVPAVQGMVDISRYAAYAQIKKAFDLGMPEVEVVRAKGTWPFMIYCIQSGSGTTGAKGHFTQNPVADSNQDQNAFIASKYPGMVPASLLNGADTILVSWSAAGGNSQFHIDIYAAKYAGETQPSTASPKTGNKYFKAVCLNSAPTQSEVESDSYYETMDEYGNLYGLLESWDVSADPQSKLDGVSNYYVDVLQNSQFIQGIEANPTYVKSVINAPTDNSVGIQLAMVPYCKYTESGTTSEVKGLVNVTALTAAEYKNSLALYDDTLVSEATLLINPLVSVPVNAPQVDLDAEICNIASERQDMLAVVGYPVESTFTKANILTILNARKLSKQGKFTIFVAGREQYNVFGLPIILNCVGGWCGATAAVAESVRTNQLASAFTYGNYQGTLLKSLTFDDVADIHDQGGCSVFLSTQGPLIWGVRTCHVRQTSYFGKANAMRVLTEILRQVFPVCLDAIHTDAAANPITRQNFNTRFNNIITDEIAAQNLIDDSYADCGPTVNTDERTKGGTVFNLNLVLHFIGLVERVTINVYATDSSVTTSIV